MFDHCHHITGTGMGGLNVNLAHLPHPGTVSDQGAQLLQAFRVIKSEIYRLHTERMARK